MPKTNEQLIESLTRFAYLLDDCFQVPGIKRRIGLDSIIGVLPVVGDSSTGLISTFLIFKSWRMGVSKGRLLRMFWNVILDTVFGCLPLMGDLFDCGWKANKKNLNCLISHLKEKTGNHNNEQFASVSA